MIQMGTLRKVSVDSSILFLHQEVLQKAKAGGRTSPAAGSSGVVRGKDPV